MLMGLLCCYGCRDFGTPQVAPLLAHVRDLRESSPVHSGRRDGVLRTLCRHSGANPSFDLRLDRQPEVVGSRAKHGAWACRNKNCFLGKPVDQTTVWGGAAFPPAFLRVFACLQKLERKGVDRGAQPWRDHLLRHHGQPARKPTGSHSHRPRHRQSGRSLFVCRRSQ